jgi:hypothetical protein
MGLTRVSSTNVLDEGLRIGEVGCRMNSKVNQSNKVCIESKRGKELGLLSICLLIVLSWPLYIGGQVSRYGRGPTQITISIYDMNSYLD